MPTARAQTGDTATQADASGSSPTARGRWVGRLKRWAFKTVVTLVVLTLISVVGNLLTTPPRTLTAPSGHDVQLPSGRMHYQHWGNSGTPLVLVHGFAEHSSAWEPVAQQLARQHEVYAVDLPGFGYSQYTGNYSLADETRALRDFITTLKLNRPIVAGHSLGAAVVGSLALHSPQLVRGIVFVDGDALPFSSSGRSGFASFVTKTPFFTSAYRVVTSTDWITRRIFDSACGSVCPASERYVAEWMRPLRQGAAEDAMKSMASAPMLALTPQQVREIRVPRAIVWGAEDARSGGSLPGARRNLSNPPTRVIAKAGHLPMVAQPEAFATAFQEVVAASHMD